MPRRMLVLALSAYLLTTWAWSLLAPLAPLLSDAAGLTPLRQALLVALPVIVGTLSRIPAGALSDRFGARTVFLLIIAVTIAALLILATAGRRSPAALLAAAGLLGVAGGTFAAAVPFVSAWFPSRRGLAIGILGLGLCGSAIGGLTAVRLASAYGMTAPFLTTALALALLGLVVIVVMRDAPHGTRAATKVGHRLAAALRLTITRQAILWYAVGFAIFVTFSTVLPVYLGNAYDLAPARAGDVMAAFVVTTVLMRPVGGWLADRLGHTRPLAVAFAAMAVAVTIQATTPPLPVLLAGVLPVVAVGIGVSGTAVVAQIGAVAPAELVGLITGVISAAGGVTGFLTPLMLATSFSRTGGYGPAMAVLVAGALLALTISVRARVSAPSPV
ncbi:nitrate/nitrite transporter [Actinoplanes sp. GCM10030250]|uniref:MFS transporter n=1 Tax=Actinoplanes sp. GCM10030250 TaxID=3273376 RepID=UPI00360C0D0F